MGDPVPTQQLPTVTDETVPPSTVLQFKPGYFKQPLLLPPQFGIDKLLTPKLTPKPTPKPMPTMSRAPSPAVSSVHVGEGAAEVTRRLREQSPSPGATDQQRGAHESRDPAKKVTLAMRAASKGSDDGLPKQLAAATPKRASRGRSDAYPRPDNGVQAGMSQEGWPTLQQSAPLMGHKCAAGLSPSPKKTKAKVARRVQVQHQLSQQALQPAPMRIFLPSAPMGAPQSFEMTKRSVALGNDEQECLDREARSSWALFTQFGGIMGTTRAVLTQPA